MARLKNYYVHIIVGLIVIAIGVMLAMSRKTATRIDDAPDHAAVVPDVELSLDVALEAAGEAGTFSSHASFVQAGGTTTVDIRADELKDETLIPSIREGTCDAPGELLFPLTPMMNGMSRSVLVMRIADLASGNASAIIDLRMSDEGPVVSCGIFMSGP